MFYVYVVWRMTEETDFFVTRIDFCDEDIAIKSTLTAKQWAEMAFDTEYPLNKVNRIVEGEPYEVITIFYTYQKPGFIL